VRFAMHPIPRYGKGTPGPRIHAVRA